MRPLLGAFLTCVSFAASPPPRIVYSKLFEGSVPPFAAITVEKDGRAVYKEGPADDNPLLFRLADGDTNEIFDLAEKLGRFGRPLESGLKVAKMGVKTFRFEEGAQATEVKFNYSVDLDAQTLLDRFERIAESERLFIDLDRTVHFDKLGVNHALLEVQVCFERKRLAAPEQFLPLLDRIVKNESYMHMDRDRAASLAETFRAPKPKTE